MTARSSSPNRTNTLTKGSIRTQVNSVYGNCNRMSLLAGNDKLINMPANINYNENVLAKCACN